MGGDAVSTTQSERELEWLSECALAFSRPERSRWSAGEITKVALCCAFVLPVRAILLLVLLFVSCAVVKIVSWASNSRRTVAWCMRVFSLLFLWLFGFMNVKTTTAKSKVPKEDESSDSRVFVCNHLSWVDVLLLWATADVTPGFVAEARIRRLPVFGTLGDVMDCVWVDRHCSAPSGMAGMLTQRVNKPGMLLYTPFGKNKLNMHWPIHSYSFEVVFPEGTSTNGRCLLAFKTGVFVSALPVKPVLIRYPFSHYSPCWCTTPVWLHVLCLLTQPVNHVEVEYLSTYIPCEAEKQDPALFATNVQRLMATALNVPIVHKTFQDKEKYQSYHQ
ncbi:lysophospholipid acyltransferase LPEAT1 [Pelomyxa schiedti]|nr:lysophospholipid acyltransferase LPEAT1 [Pelomyxa schiedti]